MRQPSPADPVARATAGREAAAQRPLPVALLLLLAAAACAAVTTEMLPVGLLPSISAGLHVSESQVGLLVSGYAAVVAVASIPMAAALQRLPRRPVLAVLLAAYGVSNAVFAASTSYGLALAARLVAGLAHAAFFAVVVSAAVALVPRAGPAGRSHWSCPAPPSPWRPASRRARPWAPCWAGAGSSPARPSCCCSWPRRSPGCCPPRRRPPRGTRRSWPRCASAACCSSPPSSRCS